MTRVYLALGSNLGDRQRFLDSAVARLRAVPELTVRRVSSYFETAPVGGPTGQGAYLNAAVEADTSLAPDYLLQTLLDIERHFGRVRSEQNAPRTLDLDLVLYGDLIRAGPDPILPHPRLHERRFVLRPLVEIAPDAVHSVLKKTVQEILDALPPDPTPPKLFPRATATGSRELAGLRALVTGSTSGIGKAIALELARAGADVIVHGRRSSEASEDVCRSVEARGSRSHFIAADLASPLECDRLEDQAWSHGKGLDIFVQNAGADLLTGDAADWPFERKWDSLVAVDINATIRLCRGLGGRMKAAGTGVMLTMGWDQAETGFAGESGLLFGTAKAAVMAFTRSLAKTLAPEVRVNCLAPGWIKTAWGESASETWQQRVAAQTPLGRWGSPEDVAATARWLAAPAAAFITGQIVRINGGVV